MVRIAVDADRRAVEAEMPVTARWTARSLYEQLSETEAKFPDRPAVTFQLKSGPKDRVDTLTWSELKAEVTRAANLFRRLGVGPEDVVAYILPNGLEAPVTLLAGATAGIVNPVNPLLSPEHIGGILRETRAKVVVTLAPFPKTDLAQNVADALALAPGVEAVLQVDLARYLNPPLKWLIPVIRPKMLHRHRARVIDFEKAVKDVPSDRLEFQETLDDRVCAYFHTGGTTGLPKIAQHRPRGMLYNGWCGVSYMFTEEDVLMTPLPMFHVFAAYPIFMSCLLSGAQVIFPTPQGYRGDGVMDNFWKLLERHRATFLIIVPTAAAALMQREVDADVSSVQTAISGSAGMPVELFRRFEDATGIKLLEGYGLTEATCLVAINPPWGERKIGSVGLPFPYTDVLILHCDRDGRITHECDVDEIGEICVKNPGVRDTVYTEAEKNRGVLTEDGYLRTGDLGRKDADGYVWITGRAKDLIIRGGHNIDPAMIEEAFMSHDAVAFAGAIGQPDRHSGEVPAVYLELVEGAEATEEELAAHAKDRIAEHAARPKHVEVLDEMPKTAVGKVFKPDLRRLAIKRILDYTLKTSSVGARVEEVRDDRKLGLVAMISHGADAQEDARAVKALGDFIVPWQWIEDGEPPQS